jgi:hypothetical protein
MKRKRLLLRKRSVSMICFGIHVESGEQWKYVVNVGSGGINE